MITVTVHAFGNRHTLSCAPDDAVCTLKARLAPVAAMAAAEMRLVAKGKTLADDDATLASLPPAKVASVDGLLAARLAAKFAKDFAQADALQCELRECFGVEVHDGLKVRFGIVVRGSKDEGPRRPQGALQYRYSGFKR